jgi:hypothetical protein
VAQQRHATPPLGVIASREDATARHSRPIVESAPAGASPGLIYRQERADPAPAPTPPASEKEQQKQASSSVELRTQIRNWLDQNNFHLGLVLDNRPKAAEEWPVFIGEQRITLKETTDRTWDDLKPVAPGLKREDVWMEVYQYYLEKDRRIDPAKWQFVVQQLWAPTFNLVHTKQDTPLFQGPQQLTLGLTKPAHKQGYGGLEHQVAVSASGLDFFSGQKNYFENVLLQYQISDVFNLGHEFKIGDSWANLQASLFAQAAIGLGVDTNPDGTKFFVGLSIQHGAGTQLTLNINSFQIIASGTVFYSWSSPTAEEGSSPAGTAGVQLGVGFGGTFDLSKRTAK